jgi:hypothetical protein
MMAELSWYSHAKVFAAFLFGAEALSTVTTMLQCKQLLAIRPRDGQ